MNGAGLPFSAACERNRAPILARLGPLFRNRRRVLEIGSGTGQHAEYFAAAMPGLVWICSDLPERLAGLRARLDAAAADNLEGPLALDVMTHWPDVAADALFSANTLHIMPEPAVEAFFHGAGERLAAGGRLVVYGPFHYGGSPTSAGNAAFDRELHARGGGEGIRDIEAVLALATEAGFRLLADCAMPANNRLLAWEKRS